MTTTERRPTVLHADPEHGGIRLVVFLSLFISFFLAFQIVVWVLDRIAPHGLRDYVTFLSCIGAVPLALLMVWGVENFLRRTWHSGLSFLIDDQGLTVRDRRTGQGLGAAAVPNVLWSEPIGLTNWYFSLLGYPRGGRERRIDKKWLCLASELQQDEAKLILYCFMPPEKAERVLTDRTADFHKINQAELYDGSFRGRLGPPTRPALPTHLLHSKEGRYWLAERRRWEFGVELSDEDFLIYLASARAAFTHEREAEPSPTPEPPPAGGA